MKKVYICAPLGGDVTDNIERAKKYARYAVKECGVTSVVPHFFALILNDNGSAERELSMKTSKSLLWFCDALWVFGDAVTAGMKEEIALAKSLNLPVKTFSDGQTQTILNGGKLHEKK